MLFSFSYCIFSYVFVFIYMLFVKCVNHFLEKKSLPYCLQHIFWTKVRDFMILWNKHWCFAELWMSAFDNLPPILIIPLLSRNGVNLRSLLFFDNGRFCFSAKDLFQIIHVESIWKVMFRFFQFLELSKSFSSYLHFLHSNKIVSSNIWLWWFFYRWKTFHTPNKAACWKLLVTSISFLIVGLSLSISSITVACLVFSC